MTKSPTSSEVPCLSGSYFLNFNSRRSAKTHPESTPECCNQKFFSEKVHADASVKGAEDEGALPVVTRFKRKYSRVSKLANANYGAVYEVQDSSRGAPAAMKLLHKRQMTSNEDLLSVRRECDIAADVSGHPNVVTTLDSHEDTRHVYIVMELCEGGSLYDYICQQGPLPESEAAQIFGQVALAVAHCHAKGIIHRDVKPENVLLKQTFQDSNGNIENVPHTSAQKLSSVTTEGGGSLSTVAKLADFGLACRTKLGEGVRGPVVGSRSYLAPEVILLQEYTHSVDVWALGVLLYMMLYCRRPFTGKSTEDIMGSILTADVKFPCQNIRGGSAPSSGAVDLMCRLLRKDPRRRPTALEVMEHPWLMSQLC